MNENGHGHWTRGSIQKSGTVWLWMTLEHGAGVSRCHRQIHQSLRIYYSVITQRCPFTAEQIIIIYTQKMITTTKVLLNLSLIMFFFLFSLLFLPMYAIITMHRGFIHRIESGRNKWTWIIKNWIKKKRSPLTGWHIGSIGWLVRRFGSSGFLCRNNYT